MITRESIEEVRSRVPIADLIGSKMELKGRGSALVGLCPFHGEKTASFYVRELDNRYHCFGCGVSGDVISFIMETEGLAFPEAVETLAERYGIPLNYTEKGGRSEEGITESRVLFRVNQLANHFFCECLKGTSGKGALNYLLGRGLTMETINKFSVGYCPPEANGLTEFFRGNNTSEEELLKAGLLRNTRTGRTFEIYRGRIIFPIFRDSKRICGFGGRILPELQKDKFFAQSPKYINSPENSVYKKSDILFGLPLAATTIRNRRRVNVVEGYMDVLGLSQSGIENTVATCGTAMTESHVRNLAKLCGNLSIIFDADEAGSKAAARCFEIFISQSVDTKVLFLRAGTDPFDFSIEHGVKTPGKLEALPQKSLLGAYISSRIRMEGSEDIGKLGGAAKDRLAREVMKIICRSPGSIIKDELVREASFLLAVPRDTLIKFTEVAAGEKKFPEKAFLDPTDDEKTTTQVESPYRLAKLDQDVLCAVMGSKGKFLGEVVTNASLLDMLSEDTLVFLHGFNSILESYDFKDDIPIIKRKTSDLLKSLGSEWGMLWREADVMSNDPDVDMKKLLQQCIFSARESGLQKIIGQTRNEAAKISNIEEQARLLNSANRLEKKLRELQVSRKGG